MKIGVRGQQGQNVPRRLDSRYEVYHQETIYEDKYYAKQLAEQRSEH